MLANKADKKKKAYATFTKKIYDKSQQTKLTKKQNIHCKEKHTEKVDKQVHMTLQWPKNGIKVIQYYNINYLLVYLDSTT